LVSHHVKGTILTVIHVVSEKLKENNAKLKTMEELFDFIH